MTYSYIEKVKDVGSEIPDNIEDLFSHLEVIKSKKEIANIHSSIHAQSNGAFLGESLIKRIANHQSKLSFSRERLEYFQTNSADSTYQGISFKIIGKLLTNDPTVKTVANIGCGFAYYDGLLAEKHQNRKFYGFDFNDDLEEENEINAKRGVKFISGYPLANIMESERRFDIVYFTSCASTIRNIELHKYLEILSKKTKYVLFSEPIYPDPCGNSIDPDSVNVHDSIPVFCQRDTYDNIFGYLCFVHNYREIAEFYGYKTIEYSVKKYKCGPYWWITYLAKKE